MTAKQIFKDKPHNGKALKMGKGGYRGSDAFAYRICSDNRNYYISVISEVNPREYTVSVSEGVTVWTLENAILYNEYVARTKENIKEKAL